MIIKKILKYIYFRLPKTVKPLADRFIWFYWADRSSRKIFFYELMPFKKPFFMFLRLFWKPKNPYPYYFQGKFTVQTDAKHQFYLQHFGRQFFIESTLFWRGLNNWEHNSVKIWIELCKFSDCVMDVGANTGVYSLICAAVNPKAAIHAFEPVDRIHEKLCYNAEINQFPITCHPFALSDKDGQATIYDMPGQHLYSLTVNKNIAYTDTNLLPTQISIVRLDSLIEKNQIPKIDLMKIDVETHEPEVLEGLGDYLGLWKPTILIEILNNEVGKKVEYQLRNADYLFFKITEEKIEAVNSLSPDPTFCNYLLCSQEVAQKLSLL